MIDVLPIAGAGKRPQLPGGSFLGADHHSQLVSRLRRSLGVPIGGGGRVFSIGPQPINASLQAYYNVERPDFGPEWSLRLQLQFLFPK